MSNLEEGYAEVEAFIADAHRFLEEHGGPTVPAFEAIGERMKPLAARPDLELLRDGASLPGNWIYSEPEGLTLMLSTFPSTTAVHTHGAWYSVLSVDPATTVTVATTPPAVDVHGVPNPALEPRLRPPNA